MLIKIYDKIKKIIRENFVFIMIIFILAILHYIPLPYYIYAPGGLVDVNSRFKIDNSNNYKGTFNLAYVSEYKATLPLIILATFNKELDIVKKSSVIASNETEKISKKRDRLLLDEANTNALIAAYNKANKQVDIISNSLIVNYIDQKAKTNININDVIVAVNGENITELEQLKQIIEKTKEKEIINLEVIRDGTHKLVTATIFSQDKQKKIGIMISNKRIIKTSPNIKFTFHDNESGPSGGLMMSLAIYNSLIPKDITHGLTIAGTGTILEDGTVGEISGIKYKLMGATQEKANIFFTPAGSNTKEARILKKQMGYDINIVSVNTLNDAINYLEKYNTNKSN